MCMPDYLWIAFLLLAISVSCTNINGYLQNYHDCLTLVSNNQKKPLIHPNLLQR
jgi:hypothetical protein